MYFLIAFFINHIESDRYPTLLENNNFSIQERISKLNS